MVICYALTETDAGGRRVPPAPGRKVVYSGANSASATTLPSHSAFRGRPRRLASVTHVSRSSTSSAIA